MSDTAGNLLFYTDGETVWNSNHDTMQNGAGILGCWSTAQGALIVPMPSIPQMYYLFTLDCDENNFISGFRYSTVDMTLDVGLGGVVQKNVFIEDSLTEQQTGTLHANGQDIWIVVHGNKTNSFYSYLLTNTGLNLVPVITSIGVNAEDVGSYMKISPDGSRLANALRDPLNLTGGVELFDFDNNTGTVVSSIFLDTTYGSTGGFGVSFSSDNSRLYVSGDDNPSVYQYDVSLATGNDMIASRYSIGTAGGALQLGADGRIYLTVPSPICGDSLGVINEPNQLGANCNPVMCQQDLNGPTASLGLPNFIESYFNELETSVTTLNQPNPSIIIHPNPTTGLFTVQGATGEIQVYDLFGRLVLRTNKREIDMGTQPKGVYVLRAGAVTRKIVLQ